MRALYEQNLNGEDLLDMRPVVAQAKTMLQFLLNQIDPLQPEGKGRAPLGLKLIRAVEHVVRMAEQFVRLETQLGPVSRAEMEQVVSGIVQVIKHFVPADQQDAALAFLRSHVGGGHHGVGGRSEKGDQAVDVEMGG